MTKSSHNGKYAIIGAGPSGLSGARNLQRFGIPYVGFEAHSDVGGLWDIDNPRSTVYQSAHLISSKKATEFTEFPMEDSVADYPSQRELRNYFRAFAKQFGLYDAYRFDTAVEHIEPRENGWFLRASDGTEEVFSGVIIANGTLSEPNLPTFAGNFNGELIHSSAYKSADIFEDKRVLIVGAGNSGCDIAVDAVHRAQKVSISVRRGYHFVPKYIFGRPADTLGGLVKLPPTVKQRIDSFLLKMFTGDPVKFGFPAPDHKLYESHPIVNSLVLYHIGHGDIDVKADIKTLDDERVEFADGSTEPYDLIVAATGYKLHFPFIDKKHLCWNSMAPSLYLNCFHPQYDNLFVLGMIEAAGIGWQGRYEMAELIARFIAADRQNHPSAQDFRKTKQHNQTDLSGGYQYLKLERMAYYVHKDTFLKKVHQHLRQFADTRTVT